MKEDGGDSPYYDMCHRQNLQTRSKTEDIQKYQQIQHILEEVLKDISPDNKEKTELREFSNKVIEELKKILEYPAIDIVQVGSTARDSNLKNDYDIDIFIRFEKNTEKEQLKEIGLELGKKVVEKLNGKHWIEYAEHPYISAEVDKYSLDIVPCYKIDWNEKIISAVDRTPLHNEFLKERLEKRNLCDDVRLLKKFLKGIGIYGSDLKTKGFSGYLCELLIIHYNGFINLLKNAKDWKIGQKIILEDIFKIYNLDEDYKFKKFNDPLIVYDPVDLNRNVAAALSKENLCKFIFYSHQFLENPSKDFFYDYRGKLRDILNDREKGLLITLKINRNKDIVDDVIYPQMDKLQKSINKVLKENDFEFLRYCNYADDDFCYLSWEFLIYELPNVKINEGPPVFDKERVNKFIKKNDKYFIKNCKVCAYTTRKYKNVHSLFNDMINGKLKGFISYPKYVHPENAILQQDIFIDRI